VSRHLLPYYEKLIHIDQRLPKRTAMNRMPL
jgi:hypothetical protein